MSIELSESTYVRAIWFGGAATCDWLAVMYREGEGDWMAMYRMRYYRDDQAFGSADRKSWVALTPQPGASVGNLEAELDAAHRLFRARMQPHRWEKIVVDGDGMAAIAELQRRDWGHVRIRPLPDVH